MSCDAPYTLRTDALVVTATDQMALSLDGGKTQLVQRDNGEYWRQLLLVVAQNTVEAKTEAGKCGCGE